MQKFIAREKHRHALTEKQDCHEVACLPAAQRQYVGIGSFALDAAVPAQVLVSAVAIVLAISQVVLLIVADQIPERESVMTGYKINAAGR